MNEHPPQHLAQGPVLVLFDFDGTLARGDSLLRFIWFAVPFPNIVLGCIKLIFRVLHQIFYFKTPTAEWGKAQVLGVFFAGRSAAALAEMGQAFCQRELPRHLYPDALARLRGHRAAGHTLALVSASADAWLRPFSAAEGMVLVCTELAYANGRFEGQLATPNCNRAEKARRVRAAFDLAAFRHIVAYGNGAGDAGMFALAQEAWLRDRGGTLRCIKNILPENSAT
jgi:HAD superfamily hydrolase (TIGR01490 family)